MTNKQHLKIEGGFDEAGLKNINEKLEELGFVGCVTFIQNPELKSGMRKVKGKRMTFEIYELGSYDRYTLVEISNLLLRAKMPKAKKIGYSEDYLLGRDEATDNVLSWFLDGKEISNGELDTLEEIFGYRKAAIYGEL